MVRDAAPHSTASIWRTVGTFIMPGAFRRFFLRPSFPPTFLPSLLLTGLCSQKRDNFTNRLFSVNNDGALDQRPSAMVIGGPSGEDHLYPLTVPPSGQVHPHLHGSALPHQMVTRFSLPRVCIML